MLPRSAQPAVSCLEKHRLRGDGPKSAVLAAHRACVREGMRGLLQIYGEEAVEVLKREIRGGGRREAPAWWYEDC